MKITVATLQYFDEALGDDLTVHATEDAAHAYLFSEIAKNWTDVQWCSDGSHCDVANCSGVPTDPTTVDRDDAVNLYHAHRYEGHQKPVITNHELEISASVIVGLLGNLIREAANAPAEPIIFDVPPTPPETPSPADYPERRWRPL